MITSDRGVQFASELWAATMRRLGIKHLMTTAFHPQSNGLVERAHRRLKEALKAWLAAADWPSHLPWVLLGLRAAPREDSGVSVAEMLYGTALSLPGQLQSAAEPAAADFCRQLQSAVPCIATRPPPTDHAAGIPQQLMEAAYVYVRSPAAAGVLAPAYKGPFRVVKTTEKYFILDLGGRFDAISVDRLKPHLGSTPPTTASPPPRGRPRKNK
jgi:hypothetical protein